MGCVGSSEPRLALSSPLSGPPLPSGRARVLTGGESKGAGGWTSEAAPRPPRLGEEDEG